MVIGVPKTLQKGKVEKEVEKFAKEYSLTQEEKNELAFIMRSFVKLYNNMSQQTHTYSQKEIIETFNGVMDSITETYNGTGLRTHADVYWKQLPCVADMLESEEKAEKVKRESKKEKADDGNENDENNSKCEPAPKPKKKTSSTYYGSSCGGSYGYSGGSCGSGYSSSYRSSYSYGGCGGGGGGYGGGHC